MILSFLVLAGLVWGQEGWTPHVTSTPISGARFEIVQSELAAKFTFKLDRYTGQVWQLVTGKSESGDETNWQETPVQGAPNFAPTNTPRFQIFTSGLAGRFTLLLDTRTGLSWVFTTFSDGNAWKPMQTFK